MPVVKHAEIRRMRQETGMKLGQFAAHAGVKYKTLANIECGGQKFVSIEVVILIARGLGIDDHKELLAGNGAEDEATEPKAEAEPEDAAAALWPAPRHAT
jgi:transcriptional regulator with XRE-family HTH domain